MFNNNHNIIITFYLLLGEVALLGNGEGITATATTTTIIKKR
jgi:hypothetical protein